MDKVFGSATLVLVILHIGLLKASDGGDKKIIPPWEEEINFDNFPEVPAEVISGGIILDSQTGGNKNEILGGNERESGDNEYNSTNTPAKKIRADMNPLKIIDFSIGNSSSSRMKKPCERMKYSSDIPPLTVKIGLPKKTLLWQKEMELALHGDTFSWDFSQLTPEKANILCTQVWIRQDIELNTTNMIPDCWSKFLPGPSNTATHKSRQYKGYFQYYQSKLEFFADLVRCNCAYKKYKNDFCSFTTAKYSKKYFFILSRKNVYYVLTHSEKPIDRRLQIIDVITDIIL